jgi:amidophosphoribosyltransferase
VNPKLTQFETSCFDGKYVTGDVTSEYLAAVEQQRHAKRQENEEENEAAQLDLNAA